METRNETLLPSLLRIHNFQCFGQEQSEKSTEVPCLEKFTTTQEASVGEYSAVHNQDTSVGLSWFFINRRAREKADALT